MSVTAELLCEKHCPLCDHYVGSWYCKGGIVHDALCLTLVDSLRSGEPSAMDACDSLFGGLKLYPTNDRDSCRCGGSRYYVARAPGDDGRGRNSSLWGCTECGPRILSSLDLANRLIGDLLYGCAEAHAACQYLFENSWEDVESPRWIVIPSPIKPSAPPKAKEDR